MLRNCSSSAWSRRGVKYIFGLPGEENAHFMMALEKSSIQFIMTRHEQAAAFMAETYGKLTGESGVCLARWDRAPPTSSPASPAQTATAPP